MMNKQRLCPVKGEKMMSSALGPLPACLPSGTQGKFGNYSIPAIPYSPMVLWDSYLLPSSRPPNISLLLFTITVDHLLAISLRRSLGVTCENVYIYGQLPNLLLRPTFHLSRFSRVFQSLSPLSSVLSLSMQTCFSKPQRKGIWSTPSFSTASFLFSFSPAKFLERTAHPFQCCLFPSALSPIPIQP